MANRVRDWFAQAERDLEQARDSRAQGRHEWACFAAHQAAAKAVKALHLRLGQEAWGHVVAKLLRELPSGVAVPEKLGAPFEHYGPLQSEEAIQYAGEILGFVRAQMA